MVISQNFSFSQSLNLSRLFLFVLSIELGLSLNSLVDAGNDRLNFVAQKKLFGFIKSDLNADGSAKITHQSRLVVYRLQAAKLFLLSRQLVIKLDLSNFLNLLVDFSWSDVVEAGSIETIEATRKYRLREEIFNRELVGFTNIVLIDLEQNFRHASLLRPRALFSNI